MFLLPPRLATMLDGDHRGTMGALLALAGGRPLCRTLGADLDLGLRLLQVPAGGAQLGPPGLEGWTPLGEWPLSPQCPLCLARAS